MNIDDAIADYNSGLSVIAVAKKHGVASTTMGRYLKKDARFVPRVPAFVSSNQHEMLTDYESGMTQKQIAKKYHTSQCNVSLILQRMPNYKPRPPQGHKRSWTKDRIEAVVAMYASGVLLYEIACAVGSNAARVREALVSAGVEIRQNQHSRPGHQNGSWKGGRRIVGGSGKKYVYIYQPDHPNSVRGCVAEHRLVVEKQIGRYLLRSEVVHHLDGNSLNNSPENLQLFASNGEHLAVDLAGRCPKWSEDGKARILAAVKLKRRSKHTDNHQKNDDQLSPSPIRQSQTQP